MKKRNLFWFLTINNYTDEELTKVKNFYNDEKNVEEIVCGQEVGDEKKTPHIHVAIRFNKNGYHSFKQMKTLFPRANFAVVSQTVKDFEKIKEYCSKDGQLLVNIVKPDKQGSRNDLTELYTFVRQQKRKLEEVGDAFPNLFMRYERSIKTVNNFHFKPRKEKPFVTVIHGRPGSGKTRFVYNFEQKNNLELYSKNISHTWFDGYQQQDICLFDEWQTGSPISFKMMLTIMDRYKLQVEIKGGTVEFNSKYIFICNSNNFDIFDETSFQEFWRRVDRLIITPDKQLLQKNYKSLEEWCDAVKRASDQKQDFQIQCNLDEEDKEKLIQQLSQSLDDVEDESSEESDSDP